MRYRSNGHNGSNGRYSRITSTGRLAGLGQDISEIPTITTVQQAQTYVKNQMYYVDGLIQDAMTYWLPTARQKLEALASELKVADPSAAWALVNPLLWFGMTLVAPKSSSILTPSRIAEVEKYLYGAVKGADDILAVIQKLVRNSIISQTDGNKVFSQRESILRYTTDAFESLRNLQSRYEMTYLARAMADIGGAIDEFGKLTGLTNVIQTIWQEGIKPIIEGGADLAKMLGALLKWLPWIAGGAAALYFLGPMAYRTFSSGSKKNPGRFRRNPGRRSGFRKRSSESGLADWLPLGIVGGALAAVALGKKSSASIASGVSASIPSGQGLIPAPSATMVNAGGVKTAGAATAVKTRLTSARIPYQMTDTGEMFSFIVPLANLQQTQEIISVAAVQYESGTM
jgi:hypothetical protein